jgi:hypothetical protein
MPHPLRTLAALLLVALAFVPPAEAKTPRTLKLRFPRTVIEAGRNVEQCVFVRLPVTEPFDLASWQITQQGFRGTGVAITHFLVYLYTGERAGEFPQRQKQAIESRACLDLGPADRDSRQLITSANTSNTRGGVPPGSGLSMPLTPTPSAPGGVPDGIGILLDANWVNGATAPRAVSARLVLTAAKPGTVRRRLTPILARDAEAGIDVPPFGIGSTDSVVDARWRPPGDACLYDITGKTHRRGRFFAVEVRDAADRPRQPLDGLRHAFTGAPTLFGSPDYTDPGTRRFPQGLFLGAGESLRYGCWHENGDLRPARLGCQEAPGLTPGAPGAPAAACAPGCTCVPANLVAGSTPDDEVCALAGFYYDAAPGGSCDVSSLPPVN